MERKLSYAIIGSGGVGGYVGIKLVHAGFDVHFLAHNDYEHIKTKGLKLDSYRGDIMLPKVNVYNHAMDLPKCDVILVCLKTTQNHILADILTSAASKDSLVVIFQNGIGVEDQIKELLPELQFAGGPIYICSHKVGPGHIQHLDIGNITLGEYSPGKINTLQQIANDFTASDIKTNIAPDLNSLRWQKLVWNVPFNGLSVVLNTTTDIIVANPHSCRLSTDIMHEVIQAANANGCKIDTSYAEKMIALTKSMIPYAPSMKVDYDNKRELEIQYIYSKPLLYGLQAGVKMPKTSMLEEELILLDQLNRNQN